MCLCAHVQDSNMTLPRAVISAIYFQVCHGHKLGHYAKINASDSCVKLLSPFPLSNPLHAKSQTFDIPFQCYISWLTLCHRQGRTKLVSLRLFVLWQSLWQPVSSFVRRALEEQILNKQTRTHLQEAMSQSANSNVQNVQSDFQKLSCSEDKLA